MKTTKYLLTGLSVLAFSAMVASAASLRIWTDSKGRKVEASFVKLDGGDIVLQTANGNLYKFPLSSLSSEDQAAAKTMKPAEESASSLTDLPQSATVAQAAARIDQLVELGLQRGNIKMMEGAAKKAEDESKKTGKTVASTYVQVKPNPPCTDAQFVRRLYLDVVGRIPNYEETTAFLSSGSRTKRAELIDKLLLSEGYVSNSFNYFADMLRMRDRFDQNQVRGLNYMSWLKQELRNNVPWDQVVHQMITAEGKVWNNGAAGYLLRDAGMPLDNLANTLNVFLGTDVACAQCHDHPFAEWTQKQFYEMASFFGGTTTRLGGRGRDPAKRLMAEMEEKMKEIGMDATRTRNQIRNFIRANEVVVHDLDQNRTKLPFDYKYKDGSPNEPVKPKLVTWNADDRSLPCYQKVDEELAKGKGENLREVFATWMTDPGNPRFAMTIANRLWARAFGMPLTQSVKNTDNLEESFNPDLLKHLGKEMVRVNFDMKKFFRIVYNTQTYQREATTAALAMGEPYYFQGPILRRMSAAQAWDSYLTLVLGKEVDKFENTQADPYGRAIDMDLEKATVQTLASKMTAMTKLAAEEQEKMGGKLTDVKVASNTNKPSNGSTMMMEEADPNARVIMVGKTKLMRASELEQPAPMGHFLSDFGQSQRLLIDGDSRAGSVPQVLSMMNGDAQKILTDRESLIHRTLKSIKDPSDKTEAIFLSILNRRCTLREKDIAKRELQSHGEEGYSNMIWALINSREFFFVQ